MTDSARETDAGERDTAATDATTSPTDAATVADAADERERAHDVVDGVWLAAEVASLVASSVAFALYLDGSTAVAVPGGTMSALAATFWLLALAALAAAGKARYRGLGTRALGHAVLAVGLGVLAGGSAVALATVGGLTVTVGTLGVVVAVAGANLVVLDLLR
jgi:hypothetical protein